MKNLINLFTIFTLTLFFVACNNETTESLSDSEASNSYTISKNANGSFTLETSEGIASIVTGGNTVDLNGTTELPVVNNEVNVNFITESTLKIPGIKIYDGQTTSSKGKGNKITDSLESYAITNLGNGTYQLDFEVTENVVVSYDYDNTTDSYMIVLEQGDNNGVTTYSKNYTKFEGQSLTITFVEQESTTLLAKRAYKKASKKIVIDSDDEN